MDMNTDKSYVVTDDFASYIVYGASTKEGVDEIVLNDDGYKADAGWTAASDDYAVVLLDEDGYATGLFLFDADGEA